MVRVAGKATDWFEHGWLYDVLCSSKVTTAEQLFSFFQRAQNVISLTRLLIFVSGHGTVAAGYNGIPAKGTLGRKKEKLSPFAPSHHPSRLLLRRVNRRLRDHRGRARLFPTLKNCTTMELLI